MSVRLRGASRKRTLLPDGSGLGSTDSLVPDESFGKHGDSVHTFLDSTAPVAVDYIVSQAQYFVKLSIVDIISARFRLMLTG